MLSRSNRAAAVVIALAIACGFALGRLSPIPADGVALEWLEAPRQVAEFTLASEQGNFTTTSLQGHWQLLVLGFTHCPDLCPTTLAELSQLLDALPRDNMRVLFVSVDPNRDSPRQLAAYLRFFADDFIGLTGAETELHQLARSLGMDFRYDGPLDSPRISHSPTIALIGPDGYLRGRLRPGFDPRQAARELRLRLRSAS